MISVLYKNINKFSKQMQKDNMGAYAASIAFFFILSVVPILMIACFIISYVHWNEQHITELLNNYIPVFLDGPVNLVINQTREQYQSVLPIAILVFVWSGGKAIWGMMMGLNTVNKVTESRNILFVRLRASFYSVILMAILIVCMGLILLSESVVDRINGFFPKLSYWFTFMGNLRFIIIWLLLTLYLSLAYTFLPNIKLKFRKQVPGAFISAVCCSVFSWGFSLYVEYFGAFNVYGSLSTMILIMFWMYTCMYMSLIGACINFCMNNGIEKFIK